MYSTHIKRKKKHTHYNFALCLCAFAHIDAAFARWMYSCLFIYQFIFNTGCSTNSFWCTYMELRLLSWGEGGAGAGGAGKQRVGGDQHASISTQPFHSHSNCETLDIWHHRVWDTLVCVLLHRYLFIPEVISRSITLLLWSLCPPTWDNTHTHTRMQVNGGEMKTGRMSPKHMLINRQQQRVRIGWRRSDGQREC